MYFLAKFELTNIMNKNKLFILANMINHFGKPSGPGENPGKKKSKK